MGDKKGSKFLLSVGRDMNVLPGKWETEDHYLERVILSAGSKWMLTAIYNGEERVTVESIRRVAQEKISNYLEIAGYSSPPDVQSIVNCLYDTLLANGMFYHEQYHVRPVNKREIGIGNISFIRGLLPEEKARFSGMAPYVPGGGTTDLAEEFMLWNRSGTETIQSAWKHSSPQNGETVIGEYLRADYRRAQKYFDC